MKIMISQPMNHINYFVLQNTRARLIKTLRKLGIEVIDTLFEVTPDSTVYRNPPLYYLGRSIDAIGKVDGVYFIDGWKEARGCLIEYEICKQYGVPILNDMPEFMKKIHNQGVEIISTEIEKQIKNNKEELENESRI